MTWRTALRLGRISNLPTVWTNVAAGMVLAGGQMRPLPFLVLALAISLLYAAGMFLNDLFDREHDRRARPERPIPRGETSVQEVWLATGILLASGVALLALAGAFREGGQAWKPVAMGLLLILAMVLYNAWHKDNPLSPFVMGFCRALVYLLAAVAVAPQLSEAVVWGAALLLLYVVGLTYAARQETLNELPYLWPLACVAAPFLYGAGVMRDGRTALLIFLIFGVFLAWTFYALSFFMMPSRRNVPEGVVRLIAGVALLDGFLIALQGEALIALAAVGGVPVTRALQRLIPAT